MATPGAPLGRALSHVLAQTIIDSQASVADHHARAKARATEETLESFERDFAPLIQGLFGGLLERDDLPDGWRSFLQTMVAPEHQSNVFLQIIGFVGAALALLPALGKIEAQQFINDFWTAHPDVPISPADLADMVERNIVGRDYAVGEAAKSGISSTAFDLLVEDTGEPPGLEQMLSLARRGLLDTETLDRMIAYSRVRLEWLPYVKLLMYDTMSPGDAIEGFIKGVFSETDSQGYFVEGGGLFEQWQQLVDISGDALGVEAALQLANHGLITEDDVDAVIRYSRINPRFEGMAKQLRHRFLAPFQVSQAIKAGAVTTETATAWLLADGYPADQVAGIVAEGAGVKVAKHKDLTEAQITELYDSGLFDHDTATAHLVALGYDPTETDFILAVYDQRRELTMAQAAINQIRKVFLAGRIDAPTATAQLASLGVDPVAQSIYVDVWTVEQQSELKELTAAQIGTAVKDGVISNQDAVNRWVQMGYTSDDALILLAIHGGPPPPGSPAAAATTTPPPAGG